MITDAIKKKINHRDNLLTDYHKELTVLGEKMAQTQTKLEAAIEDADFKKVAQLERETNNIQTEIDDVNKAIGWATEKLALPRSFITDQWRTREADYIGRIEKAKAKADKACEAFVAALRDIQSITDEAARELDEYNGLVYDEDPRPDKARGWNRIGTSIENLPLEAMFQEYLTKL